MTCHCGQPKGRNQRWCSMACRKAASRVLWRCGRCGHREPRLRSRAGVTLCTACWKATNGTRRAYLTAPEDQRLRRVMFVHGLTRERAIDWLDGWAHGKRAALEEYKRSGINPSRPRVGSAAWERLASA